MGSQLHFHEPADRKFDRLTRTSAPEAFEAFLALNSAASSSAAPGFDARLTELVGLASALMTQCAWCLEAHSRAAARVDSVSETDIAELILTVADAKIRLAANSAGRTERVSSPVGSVDGVSGEISALASRVEDMQALSTVDRTLIELVVAILGGGEDGFLEDSRSHAVDAGASAETIAAVVELVAVMNGSAAVAHGRLIWKFFMDERTT